MKKIEARCPVCRDWGLIDPIVLGQSTICPNCKQSTIAVPRTTAARNWRAFLKILILVGGVAMLVSLYNWRIDQLTRSQAGFEMPDVSTKRAP